MSDFFNSVTFTFETKFSFNTKIGTEKPHLRINILAYGYHYHWSRYSYGVTVWASSAWVVCTCESETQGVLY